MATRAHEPTPRLQGPRAAPERREEQAFGQKQPNEPRAAGAERGADGDFLVALRGSRQHQARHVDTRHEQDDSDRAEQHEEGEAKVAEDVVEQCRGRPGAAVLPGTRAPLAGVTSSSPRACGDGGEIRFRGARSRERPALLARGAEPMRAAVMRPSGNPSDGGNGEENGKFGGSTPTTAMQASE